MALDNTTKPPRITIPSEIILNDMKAILTITIKTLDLGTNMEELKKAFTGILGLNSNVTAESAWTDLKSNAIDIGNKLLDNTKDYLSGSGASFNKILEIDTYVPANFGMQLIGDWQTKNLISIEPLIEKLATTGLKHLADANLTSLLAMAYTNLKSTAEKLGNFSLSPRQTKMFNPEFASLDLDFIFKPDTKEESDNILFATKALRECMIPQSVLNAEAFMLPALIDIGIVFVESQIGEDGVETQSVSSNNIDLTSSLFEHMKDLGMSKFSATGESGDNLNLAIKDGKYASTKWSLSLTTIDKVFKNTAVTTRIQEIINNANSNPGV